jgi:hypothetical protein
MYCYTYLLINENNGMMYIGKRQSRLLPDLDTSYMGSSRHVPKEECDKIILSEFSTSLEATEDEIRLHSMYDVATNPKFYNRAKQTSTKFDTTGTTFTMTKQHCENISKATKGVKKTLTPEQRQLNKDRLTSYRTPEVRAKAAASLKANGSNKGIKNSQFKPWYISTDTVTHLFFDISKNEKSIKDGYKSKKHYTDLQRKLTSAGTNHRLYGRITAIGDIPKLIEDIV